MKKSVLSLLTLAIASVAVFTSCDKNDDYSGNNGSTTPQIQQSSNSTSDSSNSSNTSSTNVAASTFHGKALFISDSMAELGTFKVQVSDGTKTSEYDVASQGEHGTFTFKGMNNVSVTATGYMLKVVLPTKQALSCQMTYTPSAKAQAMTENDKIDAVYAFASGEGNSSNINFDLSAKSLKGIVGNKVVEFGNAVARHMSN